MSHHRPERMEGLNDGPLSPLMERFPGLRGRLPWLPLAVLPTPVEELPHPAPGGGGRLLVKRDDLTSPVYGGNKVRKLEHLLAWARLERHDVLVTLGAVGSNHALATAAHGTRLGFEVEAAVFPQPMTDHVRSNLLAHAAYGTRLHPCAGSAGAYIAARRVTARRRREGRSPFFIMAGGTTPLGTLGYVAAGLELAGQVEAGLVPRPDRIFVAAGTCGTAAGLTLGLRLAGLPARVHAVRVLDPLYCNRYVIRRLARRANALLRRYDPAVPDAGVRLGDFTLETAHFGGYGMATDAAREAIRACQGRLTLEATYTGKAMAACRERCAGDGRSETVLIWNTVSSAELPAGDPAALPEPIRAGLGGAGRGAERS